MNYNSPFYKYPHRKSIMKEKQSKTALWFSLLLVLLLGLGSIKFLSLAYQGQIALLTSDPAKPIREEIKKQVFLSLEQVAWLETLRPSDFGFKSFGSELIFSRDGRYLAIVGQFEEITKQEKKELKQSTVLIDTITQKITKLDYFLPISDWSGGVIILTSSDLEQVIAYDLTQDINRELIKEKKAYNALISPDGEKAFINYLTGGDKFESVIVWLNSGQIITMNNFEGVVSSVWQSNGRGIYGFVHNDPENPIIKLPAYFSLDSNNWEIFDLDIQEIHSKKWELLEEDKSALLTSGYDDGVFLYYIDLTLKKSLKLGELSGGNSFIKFNPNHNTYYVVNQEGILIKNIKDEQKEKIAFPPTDIDYLAEVHQDKEGNLVIVRTSIDPEKSASKEILTFQLENKIFKNRRISFNWNGTAQIKGDWMIMPSNEKIGFFLLPTS